MQQVLRGDHARLITRGAALACMLGAALAWPVLRAEWATDRALAAMQSATPSDRGDMLEATADIPPDALPPREAAALAQSALTAATEADDNGLRQLYAQRARTLIAHLHASDPHWAPCLILVAEQGLADAAPGAGPSPGTLAAFAESYRVAPFLHAEALWRIAFAGAFWNRLDPATRASAIAEAIWLTRTDGAQRRRIEAALGDSPGAVRYELALAAPSH